MPEISGNGNRKVSTEEIERRAFKIYVESGMQHGHDLEHWLAAEQELLGEEPTSMKRHERTTEEINRTAEASEQGESSMIAAFSARR